MANDPMDDHDDSEEIIDEEQLEDYREMVNDLGTFPDKVKINSLSMVAEDHADSVTNAEAIYKVIREPLISASVHSDRKLPLVYVIDSILKNVRGKYVQIIEEDAKTWMPVVYGVLPEDKRAKLKKVWDLWKDAGVFSTENWNEMGQCFSGTANMGDGSVDNTILENAGILFGKDGGLLLMPSIRDAMQALLDDLQSDEQDELNKVSLERLAAIDPDLLVKIKSTAEESLRNGTGTENSGRAHTNSSKGPNKLTDELSFLVETRTPESIERSLTWENLNLQYMKDTHDIIASLNHILRESTSVDKRYTQKEAIEMTGALATAAATADLLTNTLERIKTMETNSKKKKSSTTLSGSQGLSGASRAAAPSFFAIDKTLFTNDGIKELNEAIVGLLYDIGLPFISSADGRRFATQLELSQHLDSLFKKSQLEKIIASTQERGWYENDSVWNGDSKSAEATGGGAIADDEGSSGPTVDDEANPDTFTVPADESRDRCVICGINFKMFFDNDDGIYKYSNSREIEVMNDEASAIASEQMLVHVTCWRNLGSPEFLTEDQTLRDQ